MIFTAEPESSCMCASQLEAVISEEDGTELSQASSTSVFNTYYGEGDFDLSPE